MTHHLYWENDAPAPRSGSEPQLIEPWYAFGDVEENKQRQWDGAKAADANIGIVDKQCMFDECKGENPEENVEEGTEDRNRLERVPALPSASTFETSSPRAGSRARHPGPETAVGQSCREANPSDTNLETASAGRIDPSPRLSSGSVFAKE